MSTPTTLPVLAGATPIVVPPRQAFVEQVMGLPVSVHVRGPQARHASVAGAVAAFYTALQTDDALFSTWMPHSQVSRIRRGELRLDDASPRVRKVAALCEEASRRTGGSFSAWLPGDIDGFDPTGLVKGWAVQQAFDLLIDRIRAQGGHDLMVCAGGDIAVHSDRTDTPDWQIGIEDPRDHAKGQTIRTIRLRRGAVATSGTAARGEHIIDPATGTAPSGLLSASVIGPSLIWSDIYATAAFVRGRNAARFVASLPDHAAVLVRTDGIVEVATGLETAA